MRTVPVITLAACVLLSTNHLANAQLFGGTLGHLVDQVPGAKQINRGAGEVVKGVDKAVTQPVVAGIDHAAHQVGNTADQAGVAIDKNVTQPAAAGVVHAANEIGKAADQAGVAIDKNVTQPVAAGVVHATREVGKAADQAGVAIDDNVTQPAIGGPKHLLKEVGNGIDHFGGELDKSIFQPIGRGWTHFWGELDVIGKLKDAGHEILADADNRAEQRIHQATTEAASQAGSLEKQAAQDLLTVLRKSVTWLFFALLGAGLTTVIFLRLRKPHRNVA